jgi:hypothetical protein
MKKIKKEEIQKECKHEWCEKNTPIGKIAKCFKCEKTSKLIFLNKVPPEEFSKIFPGIKCGKIILNEFQN